MGTDDVRIDTAICVTETIMVWTIIDKITNMKNPCEDLKVERHPPVLSKMFTRLMADAIGRSEAETKLLFNIK